MAAQGVGEGHAPLNVADAAVTVIWAPVGHQEAHHVPAVAAPGRRERSTTSTCRRWRCPEWLREDEGEYWSRAGANVYQADDGLTLAIDKLMEHGRPFAAISCMGKLKMWFAGRPIDTRQCVF